MKLALDIYINGAVLPPALQYLLLLTRNSVVSDVFTQLVGLVGEQMTDVLIFGVLKQTQRKQVSPLPTLYYNRELKGHILLPFSHTCSFRTKKWQFIFHSKQMKAGRHRRLRLMSWNLLPSFPSFYLLETQADYSSQTHELQ